MDYKFEVERKLEQALRVSMVAEELERIPQGKSSDGEDVLVRMYQTAAHAWEALLIDVQRWRDSARNRSIELERRMKMEREG